MSFMFPSIRTITGASVDPIQRFAALISSCISTKNLTFGQNLHSYLIKTSLIANNFLSNRLIDFYSKGKLSEGALKVFHDNPSKNTFSWNILISGCMQNGLVGKARQLLEEMPEPNIVSYNSMLAGLIRLGYYEESVYLFRNLQRESVDGTLIDGYTLATMVGCCACLSKMRLLRQLHSMSIVMGLERNVIISNSLIDAYGKCGRPHESYSIFNHAVERDVVSWTSMVAAYSRSSFLDEASCVFSQMPNKNTVSWTALIAGFAQNGMGNKALNLFRQMQTEGVMPNSLTCVTLLGACADLALAARGKELHAHIIRFRMTADMPNAYIYNALIDMYCKSGDIKSARIMFEKLPIKDTVSWNSLITGYAQNGIGEQSLKLFEKMLQSNVKPNNVTFLGVLSACSHCGLVEDGMRILSSMEEFGLRPRSDHYAIVIDLLGRKNRLKEAVRLVKKAPEGSELVGIWGAVLGACRLHHGDTDLAKRAAEALFVLEPDNAGRYIMLSNIYASAKSWEEADSVRRLMDDRGLSKDAAFSWIVIENIVHEFVAKDKSHRQIDKIYKVLHGLMLQVKDFGGSVWTVI